MKKIKTLEGWGELSINNLKKQLQNPEIILQTGLFIQ